MIQAGRLMWCAVVVLCASAGAEEGTTFSLKLAGYLPNDYSTCRTSVGFGTGAPCTSHDDCTAPGEYCRNTFRAISCTDDADCPGPSQCVETVIVPGNPPYTAYRCSAIDSVPIGMVQPGDTAIVEIYISSWDTSPWIGICTDGWQGCHVDDPDCPNRHCASDPANDCVTDLDCLYSYCVDDECTTYPRVGGFGWKIDSTSYYNDHGPLSKLTPAEFECTGTGPNIDCGHGYTFGSDCTCAPGNCQSNVCSEESLAYIERIRGDYLLKNIENLAACRFNTDDYACNGLANPGIGREDDGAPWYVGTVMLDVSEDACGSFELSLVNTGDWCTGDATYTMDSQGHCLPRPEVTPLELWVGIEPTCYPPCNDNDLCTNDFCACDSSCEYTPKECPEGLVCDPATGQCVEGAPDCNSNGISDHEDIAAGTSDDCNGSTVPDECEVPPICSGCPDCNTNGIPDDCEQDTDGDAVIDDCDPDDDNDGVADGDDPAPLDPDVCGDDDGDTCDDCAVGTDGFGPLPDGNPAMDGPDPDEDGLCDAGDNCPNHANPGQEDCDTDGTGDVCTIADCAGDPTCGDCNGNDIPDECDLESGSSVDANDNGVPDECDGVGPPRTAPYPHDGRKNRYVSFDPNPLNVGLNVAFEVALNGLQLGSCSGNGAPCRLDHGSGDCGVCSVTGEPCISAVIDCMPPDQSCDPTGETCANDQAGSIGMTWWVGPEHPGLGGGVHLLVSEADRKVSANWPGVVHLGDCELVPRATYAIRAVNLDSGDGSDKLEVSTIAKPDMGYWADAVGSLGNYCTGDWAPCTADGDCLPGETCLEQWSPPDSHVNFHDITAAVFAFTQAPGLAVPEITWVDVHGNDGGDAGVDPPNCVVNFADIGFMVLAFQGRPYPFSDPGDCPPVGTWP